MTVAPPFAGLPDPLRRLLLIGGQGPALVPARDAAIQGGTSLAGLADALALAVWEDAPLDAAAAAVLAGRHQVRPFLPPPVARAVAAVAASARPAAPEPYYERLANRRDVPRMFAYLLERARQDPTDLSALRRLVAVAAMADGTEAAEAVLAGLGGLGNLRPLGLMLAGEVALTAGRFEVAANHLRQALAGLPLAAMRFRLAEALLGLGGRDAAVAEWTAGLAVRPFDALALGRLHDVALGLDARLVSLPGTVAVLLYSYNNAALLDRTLAGLAETDWRYAPPGDKPQLTVLDNGSSDDTAAVLAAWQDRLGDALEAVTLPVNVGAPAARNWLASLPGVRRAAFAAYLDDDAFVPRDWLGRFGAAVAATPYAGVWGCLVRGMAAPRFVQSADAHLLPTPRQGECFGRAFELARPWLATPDFGQYAVCRPCASVTGCCHLFRTETLAASGGFDIRFSPSQYDDLDHDLRLLLAGKTPVCQGHLAVIHAKATGGASGEGGRHYGSGFANQFKLHHKYDDAAVSRAAGTAFAALSEDAAAKWRALAGLGLAPVPCRDEAGHGR